jgi:uncharacterized protein with GYD domain
METYIIIGNFRGGGDMANMDFDNPDGAEDMAKKAIEAVGGRWLHSWATLGRFDLFVVVEVPNAAAVRAFVACLPEGISTETIRAFPGENRDSEFLENAKKILSVMSQ